MLIRRLRKDHVVDARVITGVNELSILLQMFDFVNIDSSSCKFFKFKLDFFTALKCSLALPHPAWSVDLRPDSLPRPDNSVRCISTPLISSLSPLLPTFSQWHDATGVWKPVCVRCLLRGTWMSLDLQMFTYFSGVSLRWLLNLDLEVVLAIYAQSNWYSKTNPDTSSALQIRILLSSLYNLGRLSSIFRPCFCPEYSNVLQCYQLTR